MPLSALKGLENFDSKGKKKEPAPKKKPVPVIAPEPEHDNTDADGYQIVRNPRTTPAARDKAVNKLKDASETALMTTGRMGVQAITQARREEVLGWMLNGHLYNGEVMSIHQLADALESPLKVVERDVAALKEKMADYHTEADQKDVPALAYMLMEMKFQDRGRALALYNIIMKDITMADLRTTEGKGALTGRDRASMYGAALQAMDLANKATNGMDSLFKMTGGAQRLQTIIKAKLVQVASTGGTLVTMDSLQEFVNNTLSNVLPSARKVNPLLKAPTIIDITPEDEEVMAIGSKK